MYYGAIHFPARDALGVGNTEYLLLYLVRQLQGGPGQNGWCDASASTLAYYVGIARRNVFVMIAKLEKMGLLEVSPNGRQRRTTERFEAAYINREKITEYDTADDLLVMKRHLSGIAGDETSPLLVTKHHQQVVTKHHQQRGRNITFTGDETSPNNNNKNKRITVRSSRSENESTPTPTPTEKNKKIEIETGVGHTVSSPATPPPPPQVAARPPAPAGPKTTWHDSEVFKSGAVAFGQTLMAAREFPADLDFTHYFVRAGRWSDKKDTPPTSRDWAADITDWIREDRRKGTMAVTTAPPSAAAPMQARRNNAVPATDNRPEADKYKRVYTHF